MSEHGQFEVVCVKLNDEFVGELDEVNYTEKCPTDPTKIYHIDKWKTRTNEVKSGWLFFDREWSKCEKAIITISNFERF